MIVSTLAQNLPTNLFVFPSAAIFNDLWNTPQGARPTNNIWASYKGSGDDLLIQRINLDPLFHRVILLNLDYGTPPSASVNSGSQAQILQGGRGTNSYYLDSTVLGLYDPTANLTSREVVRTDLSRVFQNGIWRAEIDSTITTNDFSTIAAVFFGAPAPPVALCKWNPTPHGVMDSFAAFMFAYAAWANDGTCFSYHGNGNQKFVPQYNIIADSLSFFNKQNGGGTLVP
jgi:hypothetical protein